MKLYEEAFASGVISLWPGGPQGLPSYVTRTNVLRAGPHQHFSSFNSSFPHRHMCNVQVWIPQELLRYPLDEGQEVWVKGQVFVHAVPACGPAVEFELIVHELQMDVRNFRREHTGILRIFLKSMQDSPVHLGDGTEEDAYVLQHVDDPVQQYWVSGEPWVRDLLPFFRATPGCWRWVRLPGTWAYGFEDRAWFFYQEIPDAMFAGFWTVPDSIDAPLMGPDGSLGVVHPFQPRNVPAPQPAMAHPGRQLLRRRQLLPGRPNTPRLEVVADNPQRRNLEIGAAPVVPAAVARARVGDRRQRRSQSLRVLPVRAYYRRSAKSVALRRIRRLSL